MAVLNSLLAGVLVDMWVNIITWFNTNVGNYALAIIILTVIIKLVLTPLDFLNKKVTRKNSNMQKVIQPELEKLQKKYGNDKTLYNQKMSELYKSHNYNVVGSCLFMLVNLAVTFTIFISLLNGLNFMASNKISSQYENLKTTYQQEYIAEYDIAILTLTETEAQTQATGLANEAVVIKYDEIKDSFLWIKNIWKADTTTNSIPSFSEYLALATQVTYEGETIATKNLTDEQKQVLQTEYELIMNPLREETGSANGYYILLILVVGTAILSQWLAQRKMNVGGKTSNNPAAGTTKIMMFVLPIILGVFALSSNSVFALYLLTSQLVGIATMPLIDLIIDKIEKDTTNKKEIASMANYNRKITDKDYEKLEAFDKPNQTEKNKKGEKKWPKQQEQAKMLKKQ